MVLNGNIKKNMKKITKRTTVREILQQVGTNLLRNQLHPEIWVNSLMSEYKPSQLLISKIRRAGFWLSPQKIEESLPNWIITDTRFENELKAVKDREGISIRVNREIKHQVETLGGRTNVLEGYFPTNQHESETELDNVEFDYVIDNNSDIQSLIEKVREILIKEKII